MKKAIVKIKLTNQGDLAAARCKLSKTTSTAIMKHGSPFAAARRAEMVQEIEAAQTDYRRGKVKRGSAADLMRELRGK